MKKDIIKIIAIILIIIGCIVIYHKIDTDKEVEIAGSRISGVK